MLCGKYCNDLMLRFRYTGIPPENLWYGESVGEAVRRLKENGDEDVYVVTCFSDRDKLLDLVKRDS